MFAFVLITSMAVILGSAVACLVIAFHLEKEHGSAAHNSDFIITKF